jgi:acyl carrier protein
MATRQIKLPEAFQIVKNTIPKEGHSKRVLELIKNLKPTTKIYDVLDSLDYVELIMNIEKKLCISIPDDECNKHNTFGDIAKAIISNQ